MKYIRTNYLFGEIISHTKLLNGTHLFSIKGLDEILPISEEDFGKCKVADTIEELCDKYVLEKNDYFEYVIFELFTSAKSLKLESVKDEEVVANIYGAIWTDKGLIYVAKMNEKGELKLI